MDSFCNDFASYGKLGWMSHSKPVVLSRPEQLRAITLVGHQIISVMERTRSCTVSELAEHLGSPAGSLYYHVRKLQAAGVLTSKGKQSTGGRMEVVYELAGSEVILDPTATGPRFLAALCRTIRTRLRAVERWYLDALAHPGTVRAGRGRNLSLHQHHSRLSPARRRELYRRIEELERFLIESDDPRQPTFTHVTIAVLPVVRDSDE